jgi:hypothetical protein
MQTQTRTRFQMADTWDTIVTRQSSRSMKPNEPKRHHFVPKFYQSNFADAAGLLWVYDRKAQRYFQASPQVICVEKDLYTIDPEGNQNRYVETNWLSKVDGEAAESLRRFQAGVPLDDDWKESFSVFMAQQITRSPSYRDFTTRNYQAMHEEYLRIGFTNVDRARYLLEQYRTRTGDSSGSSVTAESLVEAVTGGHMRIDVGEGPFLRHMVEQVEFLARWIVAFEWRILRAPLETGFIICDHPFVLVPAPGQPESIGLGYPGTVKYFPLTERLCLRMGEVGYGVKYENASKEDVRIINQNIAVNSERFIMGPNRTQMEYVVQRSKTAVPDASPRTTVEIVRQTSDDGLIKFTLWPRRDYFYPKT